MKAGSSFMQIKVGSMDINARINSGYRCFRCCHRGQNSFNYRMGKNELLLIVVSLKRQNRRNTVLRGRNF